MTRTHTRLSLDFLEARAVPSVAADPAPPAATTPVTGTPAAAGAPAIPPATGTPAAGTTTAPPATTPPAAGTATPPVTGGTATLPGGAPTTGATTAPPAGTPAPTTGAAAPTSPAPAPAHPLTGRGTGTFTATRANPDTGTAYKVQGTAQMPALGGPVAVAADLHTPGNVADGVTTGTLVVTTKAGSVTVALTSFRPPAAAGVPVWYRYRVTAGTGTLAGLHDTGSLRLDWVPAPAPIPPMPAGPATPAAPSTGSGAGTAAASQSPAAAAPTGPATAPVTPPATATAGACMGAGGSSSGSSATPGQVGVQRGTFRLTV
jgi:hypothetical protein